MSIASKTGDKGETSLMYGRRVSKHDPRVEAGGSVDELMSALGFARAAANDKWTGDQLLGIQKELITVMGELATAPQDLDRYRGDGFQVTSGGMVDRLTMLIDQLEREPNMKFTDWVLPGASLASAALDLARTTCRRAERHIMALQNS